MMRRFYIYTEVGEYDPFVVRDEKSRYVGRYHTMNAAKKRVARETAKRPVQKLSDGPRSRRIREQP